MEVSVRETVEAFHALSELAQVPAPPKTAFHVVRLLNALRPEYNAYDHARLALVKRLGSERDATEEEAARGLPSRVTVVPRERMEEFTREHNGLLEERVSIAAQPLTEAQLETLPAIKASTIAGLGPCLAS